MIHNDGGYPPNINSLDTGIEDVELKNEECIEEADSCDGNCYNCPYYNF